MTRRFPTREQRREEDERVQASIVYLVTEFEQVDADNIETITGSPHDEKDGLEDDLALYFGVAPNSIINAANRLREAGEISYRSEKGGPAHDPRSVITRIALPAEPR